MNALGFLKAHRLSSKIDIDTLFSEGNSFTEFPFRFIWNTSKSKEFLFQIVISIPKKRFPHAVDRNLLKRRVREAFRKEYLQNLQNQSGEITIHLAIVYIDSAPRLQHEIDEKIGIAIKKVISHVQNM